MTVEQDKGTVTAALLVIGEEILSGRTKDENIAYIAAYLTRIGISLREIRVVADREAEIAAAVNALRPRYTYVFTTGGIGPTHDDVTTDAIGELLSLSPATVRNYLSNAISKLGARNRIDAIRIARNAGWL